MGKPDAPCLWLHPVSHFEWFSLLLLLILLPPRWLRVGQREAWLDWFLSYFSLLDITTTQLMIADLIRLGNVQPVSCRLLSFLLLFLYLLFFFFFSKLCRMMTGGSVRRVMNE